MRSDAVTSPWNCCCSHSTISSGDALVWFHHCCEVVDMSGKLTGSRARCTGVHAPPLRAALRDDALCRPMCADNTCGTGETCSFTYSDESLRRCIFDCESGANPHRHPGTCAGTSCTLTVGQTPRFIAFQARAKSPAPQMYDRWPAPRRPALRARRRHPAVPELPLDALGVGEAFI